MRAPVHVADEQARQRVARLPAERPPRQRPKPHVPIEPVRHGHGLVRGPRTRHERPRLAVGIDFLELPDPAVADQLAGLPELAVVFGSLLRPRLVNPPVATGRLDQDLGLLHGNGDRFLAVDILAGSHGHDRHRRRPMIRQRKQHGVDIGTCEDLAEIIVRLHAVVARPAEPLGVDLIAPLPCGFASFAAHVADRHHLHVVSSDVPSRHVGPRPSHEMAAPLAAQADEAHVHAFARGDAAPGPQGGTAQSHTAKPPWTPPLSGTPFVSLSSDRP